MKAIFKGNKFAIQWTIKDAVTSLPFDFTGMFVEYILYSDSYKGRIVGATTNINKMQAEIPANILTVGVYNIICKYRNSINEGHCIYRNAFQITRNPEFIGCDNVVVIESFSAPLKLENMDINYLGHFTSSDLLIDCNQPSWALVGKLNEAEPWFFYTEDAIPAGSQYGWNNMSDILGKYNLLTSSKEVYHTTLFDRFTSYQQIDGASVTKEDTTEINNIIGAIKTNKSVSFYYNPSKTTFNYFGTLDCYFNETETEFGCYIPTEDGYIVARCNLSNPNQWSLVRGQSTGEDTSVTNYNQLKERPSINGVTLTGNHNPAELDLATITQFNQVKDISNHSLDVSNQSDRKSDSAVNTANQSDTKANEAINIAEEAKSTAELAKIAVKTLEGLANATEAQQVLAAQVVQIEENKQNIESNKAETDEKFTELATRVNVLKFEGKGTESIIQKYFGIIGGHTYRVYPSNPNWDTTGLDGNVAMEIYYVDANGNAKIEHSRVGGTDGEEYYDVTIPSTAKLEKGLYIYFRGAVGVECIFSILDITNNSNGIIEIKAISNSRPPTLAAGDFYYNTTYDRIYEIKSDGGYREYKPSNKVLYRLGNEYYQYNGSTLIGINDWMANGKTIEIARYTDTIRPSDMSLYKVGVPEGEIYKCHIRINITGTAEYYVALVDVDGVHSVIKNYTTSNSDFIHNISYGYRLGIFFTSTSSGSVEVVMDVDVPSYISVSDMAKSTKQEVSKKVDADSMAYGYAYEHNNENLWEQGHFKNDGSKGDSSAAYYSIRIRTSNGISNRTESIYLKKGYKAAVLRYDKSGTYIDNLGYFTGEFTYDFDFENYLYQMEVGTTSNSAIDVSAYSNVLFLSNKINISGGSETDNIKSIYNKDVNWGGVPVGFYECKQEDFSFGEQYNSSRKIIEMFDTLPLEKEAIGTASDGSTMYAYKLSSSRPVVSGTESKIKGTPKIIIVAGQHGFEKNAPYATYYFMKDLCENTSKSEILRWMRANIDFIVIPCANPWGIDNYEYVNANGVNLNRNWGVENWEATITDTTSFQYQGESAFDQPETAAIRDIILANKDAVAVIDFHTNGSGVVAKNNINWLSLQNPFEADDYYCRLRDAAVAHLCNVSSMFNLIYKNEVGGDGTEICGFVGSHTPGNTGYLESYAVEQGFFGLTFEGCNQLPNETELLSPTVKKLNTELIGNFIATLAYYIKD